MAGGCKLLRNRYENRDREWASYTCVLGFHVFGERPGRRGEEVGEGVWRTEEWLARASHLSKPLPTARWFCRKFSKGGSNRCTHQSLASGSLRVKRPNLSLSLPPAGVWPDGSDGTDINSLCRSHNERVVAVADDFCKVHLFQYPCAKPKVDSALAGTGWDGRVHPRQELIHLCVGDANKGP